MFLQFHMYPCVCSLLINLIGKHKATQLRIERIFKERIHDLSLAEQHTYETMTVYFPFCNLENLFLQRPVGQAPHCGLRRQEQDSVCEGERKNWREKERGRGGGRSKMRGVNDPLPLPSPRLQIWMSYRGLNP